MKTQRYSVPGHPCLYIGYSIYGSWEEMSRPTFENCMVSILVNTAEIKTLDLRIPTVDKWNRDMTECLLLYPLILSCMIQVKDSKDDFKPEYIIPQLIMEWLIVHNFMKGRNDEFMEYFIHQLTKMKTSVILLRS